MPKKTEIGYGIVIKIGATMAATTATVTLAGASDITIPGWERGVADVTSFDDGDYHKHFIAALAESGDLETELFWLPNGVTDTLLETLKAERDTRYIEVQFPNIGVTPVPKISFRAFLTAKSPTTPMEEGMTCSARWKTDGAVTTGTVAP